MSDLTINNWMVAWSPDLGDDMVKVGPWPDTTGWSDPYDCTIGCCVLERAKWPLWKKIAMMFIDFHTLVVGDGIDPVAAHREFMKIDEYRHRISPDIPETIRK